MQFITGFNLAVLLLCSLLWAEESTNLNQSRPENLSGRVDQPPNIIMIMAADMGIADTSASGNQSVKTPALDQLAKNSARWSNFYVSPVCSPTRASVMTGRYNIRTKCVDTNLGRSMMATDEVTIGEAMSGSGYNTGIFGKWHLGDNYPYRPSDQGFATSLVHRGSGLGQPSDPIESVHSYSDPILFKNNHEIQTNGYFTDIIFRAATDFIKTSKQNQQSFFASINVPMASGSSSDIAEKNQPKYNAKDISALGETKQDLPAIAAMIENFDTNLAKLIAFLKKEKLYQNCVILLLSDTGVNSDRYNAGFRGEKEQVYEGGIRSPLWIHWPAKIKNGRQIDQNLAAHIDLMPTILDMCQLGVPAAFEFDGRSFASQIIDPKVVLPQRPIIIQWHRGAKQIKRRHFMIRRGKWKLLNPSKSHLSERDTQKFELYDLVADPGESTNLADAQKARVTSMLEDYDKWYDDVTETRIRDTGTPYILVDRAEENPLVLTWQNRIAKKSSFEGAGFWKLQFEHDARCDVRLEFPSTYQRDFSDWKMQLHIGNDQYTKEIITNQKSYLFPALNIMKGKQLVSAFFVSPDGKESVSSYQIRLLHR